MIRGIHHFAINTANFDLLVDFYKLGLGFEQVGPEFSWKDSEFVDSVVDLKGSAAKTIMLHAGNTYLEVFEYFAPPPREGGPARPSDRGYTHFCIDTDDIEGDYGRLIKAGMRFPEIIPNEMGGIRALYGKDPEGNVIELQQLADGHAFHMGKLRGASGLKVATLPGQVDQS